MHFILHPYISFCFVFFVFYKNILDVLYPCPIKYLGFIDFRQWISKRERKKYINYNNPWKPKPPKKKKKPTTKWFKVLRKLSVSNGNIVCNISISDRDVTGIAEWQKSLVTDATKRHSGRDKTQNGLFSKNIWNPLLFRESKCSITHRMYEKKKEKSIKFTKQNQKKSRQSKIKMP